MVHFLMGSNNCYAKQQSRVSTARRRLKSFFLKRNRCPELGAQWYSYGNLYNFRPWIPIFCICKEMGRGSESPDTYEYFQKQKFGIFSSPI